MHRLTTGADGGDGDTGETQANRGADESMESRTAARCRHSTRRSRPKQAKRQALAGRQPWSLELSGCKRNEMKLFGESGAAQAHPLSTRCPLPLRPGMVAKVCNGPPEVTRWTSTTRLSSTLLSHPLPPHSPRLSLLVFSGQPHLLRTYLR
jgi:hypothetical protein